jgi:hypothetical protein
MSMSGVRTDPPRKLLAGRAIKLRIALASGLVLAIGAWLAPRPAQTTLSAPQEHAAPLLEEQVQLREVSRPFLGVQDVALQAREQIVAILKPASHAVPSRNEPSTSATRVAGFGVFLRSMAGRRSICRSDRAARCLPRSWRTSPQPDSFFCRRRPERTDAPAAGALAVAVGRSDERDLAVPVFVTSVGADRFTIGAVNDAILRS